MSVPHDDGSAELIREADRITELLRAIRAILQQPLDSAIAENGLTAPQVNLIRVLSHDDGLSLKELSQRLGLSHSTVSGIVDRLEKIDLATRKPDEADRRFTRIYLTSRVTEFLESSSDLHYPARLVESLGRAKPDERKTILDGLTTLRRLLESQPNADS